MQNGEIRVATQLAPQRALFCKMGIRNPMCTADGMSPFCISKWGVLFPSVFFRVPLPTESNNICELPVCLHAFRALFCITRKISQYFRKHEASTLFGPIQHGNCNTRNRYNGSKVKQSENDVIVFLQSNSDTYGEAYATRFIRELCGSGLRKEE